jgi:endonuclease/exonuclease/phosphatase family metal-dependent hydrolase
MAIDHALVDRRARIQDFRVVSVAGSDHAALITRIVVPASGP